MKNNHHHNHKNPNENTEKINKGKGIWNDKSHKGWARSVDKTRIKCNHHDKGPKVGPHTDFQSFPSFVNSLDSRRRFQTNDFYRLFPDNYHWSCKRVFVLFWFRTERNPGHPTPPPIPFNIQTCRLFVCLFANSILTRSRWGTRRGNEEDHRATVATHDALIEFQCLISVGCSFITTR